MPDGEPGELMVRADEPFAFATGYFAMPEKTARRGAISGSTPATASSASADGYFRFVDRLKDAIRRRGENISSFEVEQVLLSHPAVANAAVFPGALGARRGRGDGGDRALQPGERPTELELIEFCEPRLPYFAVPRYIEFVDELPMTENGKVQKYKLSERGVSAATWDREAAGYRLKRL